MKNYYHQPRKQIKMFSLLFAFCFLLANIAIGSDMYVKEGKLVVKYPGDIFQDCLFYENPYLSWAVFINNENRGWVSRGQYKIEIPLRDGELGEKLKVYANAYGKDCFTRSSFVYRQLQLGEIEVPNYQATSGTVVFEKVELAGFLEYGVRVSLSNVSLPCNKSKDRFYNKEDHTAENRNALRSTSEGIPVTYGQPIEVTIESFGDLTSFDHLRTYHTDSRNNGVNLRELSGDATKTTYILEPQFNYPELYASTLELGVNIDGALYLPFSIKLITVGVNPNTEVLGTTTSPQVPWLVLHDPPGDASYSFLEKNGQVCREYSMQYEVAGQAGAYGTAKIGAKGETTAGFIVEQSVEYEAYVETTQSMTIGGGITSTKNNQICMDIASRFQTSAYDPQGAEVDDPRITGDRGDVFIGLGIDYNYGMYKQFRHDCGIVILEEEVMFAPVAFRDFVLTENGIEDDIERQKKLAENENNSAKVRSEANAQAQLWKEVLQKNKQNRDNAITVPGLRGQRFEGGPQQDKSWTVTETGSSELDINLYFEREVKVDAKVEVAGSGIGGGFYAKARLGMNRTTTESNGSSRTIGYHIEDGDLEDLFVMDIKQDPQYGTPIFILDQEGTRSSCPYEGGTALDQPELSGIVNGVNIQTLNISNVAAGSTATVDLLIKNNSPINRTYFLELDDDSNLYPGAELKVGTQTLGVNDKGIKFDGSNDNGLAPGETKRVKLFIEQNEDLPNVLAYEGIKLYLYSDCQEDIRSTILINVNFQDENSITVTPGDQSVSASSGSIGFAVSTQNNWTVSSNASWVEVSPESGNGNGSFRASYLPNTTINERSAQITIRNNEGIEKQITITQAAGEFTCDNWIQIADEGGTLTFEGEEYIRFGVGDLFTVKKVANGTPCNIDNFGGDPAPNQRKGCYQCGTLEPFLELSSDNETVFSGFGAVVINITSNVSWSATSDANWLSVSPSTGSDNGHISIRYNANEAFFQRVGTVTVASENNTYSITITQEAGEFFCDNWVEIAAEGDMLDIDGPQFIRFGADDGFVVKEVAAGSSCDNTTFGGDPAPGVSKKCYQCIAEEPYLELSSLNEFVSAESGTVTVNVSSNSSWSVSNPDNWLKVSPSEGNGDGQIILNYDANEGTSERVESVFIPFGLGIYVITVTQAGNSFTCDNWVEIAEEAAILEITERQTIRYGVDGQFVEQEVEPGSPCTNETFGGDPAPGVRKKCYTCSTEGPYLEVSSEIEFVSATSGAIAVNINANVSWEASSNANWLMVSPNTGNGNGQLIITYTDNEESVEREGIIFIDYEDKTHSIFVVQEMGMEEVGESTTFCDDFNNYQAGESIANQSNRWEKWSSSSQDALIASSPSLGEGNALLIERIASAEDQMDVLLKLGNLNSGTYDLTWKMYVPEGKTGYFNSQKIENDPGAETGFQIYFSSNGIGEVQTGRASSRFDFLQNQWFEIRLTYQFTEDLVTLYLDNVKIEQWRPSSTLSPKRGLKQLGALDFYAVDNAFYFIDDFCIEESFNLTNSNSRSSNKLMDSSGQTKFTLKSNLQITDLVELGQNRPNPAGRFTKIPVVIQNNIESAALKIVDLNGRMIRELPITERGHSFVKIEVDLPLGMYFYSLITDGQVKDTKRMIIAH